MYTGWWLPWEIIYQCVIAKNKHVTAKSRKFLPGQVSLNPPKQLVVSELSCCGLLSLDWGVDWFPGFGGVSNEFGEVQHIQSCLNCCSKQGA